jgi:transketolase
MSELVNRPYEAAFMAFASQRPEVLCLSSDLTSSCEVDKFRDLHPGQFLSLGMAEQNMLSFAAGLSMGGYVPFLHTFGVFLYRRPYDQLVNSIAYPNRRVRLMAFLPGITTPGGATHQAIEDVAMMRALPNMTILETGDATEVESVLEVADAVDGPVYVRVLRGQVPRLFKEPMVFNQLRVLSEGGDVLLVSSGICTEDAMRATPWLRAHGIRVTHLHASTLKPFDVKTFLSYARGIRRVVTMENHTIIGGLGSLVAELMAESGHGGTLVRLGLRDTFAHGASRPYLARRYGMDALALVQAVGQLLGRDLKVTEADLQAVRFDSVHSSAKAEAL